MIELWHRPWAKLDRSGRRYTLIDGDAFVRDARETGPLWLCLQERDEPVVDGKRKLAEVITDLGDGRRVYSLPLPLRPTVGLKLDRPGRSRGHVSIVPRGLLMRPPKEGQADLGAVELFTRVKAVWTRLSDVEDVLGDPATIWQRLAALWMSGAAEDDPKRDVIVRHARKLGQTLDIIDKRPRRILRRTQQLVPLSRVQELDRKAITWLIRQPGETVVERAGSRQRIRAVTREENFNTLENRVVLSYARLADHLARDYCNRNRSAAQSSRYAAVLAFRRKTQRLAQNLADMGVIAANPDVTPNFVLQNNPAYHAVWIAWRELLRHHRVIDDLWHWQARSWEEFTALALVVALHGIPGARILATSPLIFEEEQRRGCWLTHVNPLATVFLAEQGVVAEVSYRPHYKGSLRSFAAPIWLRVGRLNVPLENQPYWVVWPLWDAVGGIDPDVQEAEEIESVLEAGGKTVVRGIVVRPTRAAGGIERQSSKRATVVTLGASGDALRQGIEALRDIVVADIGGGRGHG
ncbi:DUF2357 domain-containing protein [Siculibacillus lacustris]|uniref:DUF2357 domain-containing protein n=1 Tax=Siculibacillus lacustris TaxID=1549641 RepID=A0A4Q9VTI0_9HYPH|nr:DUF2357 domain-containing protein [Siculibacillus lacustris]TBW38400.1 DUF2357 domain-containing protein [Siculibacillus lacustris]